MPTRLVSNEEFAPIAQTPAQAQVERRIEALAARAADKMFLDLREKGRKQGWNPALANDPVDPEDLHWQKFIKSPG